MAENRQMQVLVIGGGIAGLLVAQGLQKNGISVAVYESEPSAAHYRPREWGMSIQWGLPMLEHVLPKDLFDRLHEAANDPNFELPDPGIMPTFNGATGEHIKDIPLLRMIRVSRRRFRTFCTQGLTIEYGKTLRTVSYSEDGNSVTALFEDGTSATGTTLVGADGVNSAVRTSIFGPDKAKLQYVPYCGLNTHVCYGDAEKALFVRQKHPIMYHAIHPDGYWLFVAIQDVPDPDDPSTWTFQLQCTWKNSGNDDPTDMAAHRKRAETFGEPFRSASLWMPEDNVLGANFLNYWEPMPWDGKNGRITLVGDAAHPMTFQRGQGMNHGIADSKVLVDELFTFKQGKKTAAETMDSYQEEMISRAGEEVRLSIVNTEMLHDWNRFQDRAIFTKGGVAGVKLSEIQKPSES